MRDSAALVDEDGARRAFLEEDYLAPIATVTPRIMLTVGATWGMSFFLFMSILDPAKLIPLAAASSIGGSLFGLIWGGWFCWYVRRFNRRLLRTPEKFFDPEIVSKVRADEPQLEILGNQRQGHAAVGGVLVLTRRALWFVPHILNAKPYRQPVRIPLDEIVDLEVVARSRMEIWFTGDRKDLFPGRLKVTSSQGSWEFNVGTREMLVTLVERLGPLLPLAADVERLLSGGSAESIPSSEAVHSPDSVAA